MAEGEIVPPLDDVARPTAVGDDGKEVGGFQRGLFQETLDDLGGTRLVVGENQADFVGLEDEVGFFHYLGDAQGRRRELEGGVEAVARGGEIEHKAFLPFFGAGRERRHAQRGERRREGGATDTPQGFSSRHLLHIRSFFGFLGQN